MVYHRQNTDKTVEAIAQKCQNHLESINLCRCDNLISDDSLVVLATNCPLFSSRLMLNTVRSSQTRRCPSLRRTARISSQSALNTVMISRMFRWWLLLKSVLFSSQSRFLTARSSRSRRYGPLYRNVGISGRSILVGEIRSLLHP